MKDPKLGWDKEDGNDNGNNQEQNNTQQQIDNTTDGSQDEKYVPKQDNTEYPLLKDVFGSQDLKNELEEIITNIENEQIFEMMQTKPYRSYMYQGPHGNGKTFSAKAIRNEVAQRGHNVVWAPYNIGEYGTAYINMGARYLQQFFDSARKAAEQGNKVLMFMDEADVLLSKRGGSSSHKEDDKLLDCLMKNLQYINDYGKNQYIAFATNYPDAIDNASIRSGRIDKTVQFDKPDYNVRWQLFKYKTEEYNKKFANYFGMTSDKEISMFKKMNYKKLAEESAGLSMADIQAVYDRGIRSKVYNFIKEESNVINHIPKVGENNMLTEIHKIRDEKGYDKKGMGFR